MRASVRRFKMQRVQFQEVTGFDQTGLICTSDRVSLAATLPKVAGKCRRVRVIYVERRWFVWSLLDGRTLRSSRQRRPSAGPPISPRF